MIYGYEFLFTYKDILRVISETEEICQVLTVKGVFDGNTRHNTNKLTITLYNGSTLVIRDRTNEEKEQYKKISMIINQFWYYQNLLSNHTVSEAMKIVDSSVYDEKENKWI